MLLKEVFKYQNLSILEMYNSIAMCSHTRHGYGHLGTNSFYWVYDAQPSAISDIYRILVIYHKDNYSPYVYILSNDMSQLSKAPHLYDREKIRLCLYYPIGNKEWTKRDSLCNTIVVWTNLWLYYYEEWLYSGKWKGGGIHPPPKDEEVEEKKLSPLKSIRGNKNKRKNKNSKAVNYINRIYKNQKEKFFQLKVKL